MCCIFFALLTVLTLAHGTFFGWPITRATCIGKTDWKTGVAPPSRQDASGPDILRGVAQQPSFSSLSTIL